MTRKIVRKKAKKHAICSALMRFATETRLGDEGLPIGVRIVGTWLEDRTRLKLVGADRAGGC
jgi:hypothetical protein